MDRVSRKGRDFFVAHPSFQCQNQLLNAGRCQKLLWAETSQICWPILIYINVCIYFLLLLLRRLILLGGAR